MEKVFGLMLLLFFASCSTTKTNPNNSKTSAELFESKVDPAKFLEKGDSEMGEEKIIILFTKFVLMAGRKNILKVSYDSKTDQWNGNYQIHKSSMEGMEQKEEVSEWKNLTPKSGWTELINRISANKIHSLKDSKDLVYDENIADGNSYRIQLKVNDKFRSYSYSNPMYYAGENPTLEDFKNMTNLIKIFEEELIETIDKESNN